MEDDWAWSDMAAKPEYEWLAEAKRFLLGADVLRGSAAYASGSLLITPTLHLLAHGIELFLKGTLIRDGGTVVGARNFGHDVVALWNAPGNVTTRADLLAAAEKEWDDFNGSQQALLEEHLRCLGELHSTQSGFALRYTTGRTATTAGPKPHLLIAGFICVVDRYIEDMRSTAS